MVEEIILNPANLDGSNNANFRFSVYHNGSDFPSDELVLYVYTIYDVREDITDSDGDGIDDEFDTCPNGETGWTSTPLTDYDSDGCRDATEDDDDNDIVLDVVDDCSTGELNPYLILQLTMTAMAVEIFTQKIQMTIMMVTVTQ